MIIDHNLLQYDVAMFQPKATGFHVHARGGSEEPLQAMDVEIATVFAEGPRPVVYAPPTYEEEAKHNHSSASEARGTLSNSFKSYDLQC